ncbi:MAG: PKD domain-containing protein, partial [Gammaproteobacteria bacterium]
YSWDGNDVTNASEIFDPADYSLTPVSGLPIHGKVDLLGVRLYDGTVVTPTGGNEFIQVLPDTSVYYPNKDEFRLAGSVQFPRTTGYNTGALIPDGRIVAAGGIGLSSAGAPIFFPIGEIYTPSDFAQAKGLKKVIGDLPVSAFMEAEDKQKLKDRVDAIMDILRDEGQEKQAKLRLVNQVIKRIDGCAGGNPDNDLIVACDDQAVPYAVSIRLAATLDELLGNLLPPDLTATATPTSGPYPLTVDFMANAVDPDGSVISYYWDFGDGKNSILPNPQSTYACPGSYSAISSVIDSDGLVAEETITITPEYPDGVTASYNCDILPAHTAFCGKVCHFPDSPQGAGIDLTSYDGIMNSVSTSDPTQLIVIPGDPENSPIVIATDPPRFHSNDVGGERLNDTVRAKQRAWIAEGANNN